MLEGNLHLNISNEQFLQPKNHCFLSILPDDKVLFLPIEGNDLLILFNFLYSQECSILDGDESKVIVRLCNIKHLSIIEEGDRVDFFGWGELYALGSN